MAGLMKQPHFGSLAMNSCPGLLSAEKNLRGREGQIIQISVALAGRALERLKRQSVSYSWQLRERAKLPCG